MGNVHMEAAQINYRGGEKKMSVEEALKNTSGEAAAIAQLQQDVSDLNDVKANKITIAPAFSAEASYDPGDLVYYNGLTYRCVNAHSGEWDADDFAATTIDNELSELRSGLTNLIVNQPTTITFDANGIGTFDIPTGYIPLMAYMDENWKADIYCMNGTWIIRARAWNDPIKFIKSSAHSFDVIFVKE